MVAMCFRHLALADRRAKKFIKIVQMFIVSDSFCSRQCCPIGYKGKNTWRMNKNPTNVCGLARQVDKNAKSEFL